MANIICGISDIPFKCSYVPITLHNREYAHPIFAVEQRHLLTVYKKYTRGELTTVDSYLLFLALLKSTEKVEFVVPAKLTTSTPQIIANNIGQLVSVIWNTNAIMHPKFKQPRFFIRKDTATLDNVKMWISAWQKNISDFKAGIDSANEIRNLKKVEDKLSKIIFSPEAGETRLAAACAEWADTAASFPVAKREKWKLIIRKCYNLEAMFSTAKSDLVELKDYCEGHLEAGSIHYHNLMKTLRTGIANHNDFLGLGSLTGTNDSCGYTLIQEDTAKLEASLLNVIAKAPDKEPIATDYPSKLEYLKAKLAYREACKVNARTNTTSNTGDTI